MPVLLPRRAAFGLMAGGCLAVPRGGAAAAPEDWADYKTRFLSPEGRVVDTGNANQSHTEGQGWALALAEHHDDRAAFDRVLAWTRRNLRRERDHLHAWRWQPGARPPVQDSNNATDGDLFIASALLKGGRRWSDPALTEEGTAVARDVLRLLVRRVGGALVLLPGARGFEARDHVVLNPSYYALPAIAAVAEAVPDPAWLRVVSDGLRLLRAARFGRWNLPPDWIAVSRADGRVSLAPGRPARFSYDAVRVPLWLSWAGMADEGAVAACLAFWSDPALRDVPAWADLTTDAVSPYPAGAGVRAIARLAAAARGQRWPRGAEIAARNPQTADYYDASLRLLAGMAAGGGGRTA